MFHKPTHKYLLTGLPQVQLLLISYHAPNFFKQYIKQTTCQIVDIMQFCSHKTNIDTERKWKYALAIDVCLILLATTKLSWFQQIWNIKMLFTSLNT